MRRPVHGGRPISAAAYTWAVVLAGAAAVGASLPGAIWPAVHVTFTLGAASILANALMVPMPGGGYQTLAPAVVAAGLVLFGASVAVPVLALGALVANSLVRRRPLAISAFNAGQRALAVLAAGVAAHLLYPGHAGWARPVFDGRIDTAFAVAMFAAAAAFATVSGALVNWRVSLDRRASFAEVLGANLAIDEVNTLVLFLIGTTAALVMVGALPPNALLLGIPALLASAVLMVYAHHRQDAAALEVISAVGADLSRNLTVDDIVRVAAAGVDRLAPSEVAMVWIQPPGGGPARVVHYQGPGGMELARQFEPAGLTAMAMRAGLPVRTGDYERDPRRNPRAESLFGAELVRSALAVPMVAGGENVGAVALISSSRHHFTARHERLVGALAAQAAQAIRTVHTREETRRQAERLAALRRPSLAAGWPLDLREVGIHLVTRAAETVGAPWAYLALCDEQRRELAGQTAYGADPRAFAALRAPLDGDEAALHEAIQAIRERRRLVLDEAAIENSACPSLRTLPGARGAVVLPLFRDGQPLGALAVARRDPPMFAESEIGELETLAAHGGLALDNARRHASVEQALGRLEAFIDIAQRIAGTPDVRSVFSVIAEGAREMLGTPRILLVVWDGSGPAQDVLAAGVSETFAAALADQIHVTVGRYVAQATQAVVIGDLASDPRMGVLRDAAAREGLRAAAFFPLRAQGEFVGVLGFLHDDEAGFHADGLRLVEAFADQAALAVQHALLQARTEDRLEDVALMNRVVGLVNASLDLGEVYRVAVEQLAGAVSLPRISLYRVEGAVLRMAAQAGAPDAPAEIPVTSGLRGRAAQTGRPQFVPNVRDEPDYVPGHLDVTSMAVVPILMDGAAAAVLVAEGVTARPVTQRVFGFMVSVAQHLGVAVRNASLHQELRRTHDELQVLFEAAKAVSGTLELRPVLDSLVSGTCRAFEYETGAVLLVDQATGDLTVESAYGYREPVTGVVLPRGTGISGWVALSGAPLIVDDVRGDPRYFLVDDRTRSELAVPLIAEGKVAGVFNVESAQAAAFGPRDLHLLTTLASYAVVAIQNARLYEQARRLASTDGLTELYNHRYFYEALERTLERARRDGQPLAMVMLEIDRFKSYNDTYGHQRGDEVLRTVAGLLRRGSRPSDIVARYGGDEFMVVLPGVGKAAGEETAERLRRAVEAFPMVIGEQAVSITLSVGVAAFPQDGATADALVEAVDRAQYAAKQSGGNRVHVAHAS